MLIDDVSASRANMPVPLTDAIAFQMQNVWEALPEVGWQEPVRRLLDTTPCTPPFRHTWFEILMHPPMRGGASVPMGVTCTIRSIDEAILDMNQTKTGAARRHGVKVVGDLADAGAARFVGGAWIGNFFGRIAPVTLVYLPLDDHDMMLPSRSPSGDGYNVIVLDLMDGGSVIGRPMPPQPETAMVNAAWHLAYFLAILHVKNIVVEEHVPSVKMQRARCRRGRPPFVTYKTLRVVSPGSAAPRDGERRPPTHSVPFHLVRGHFSHYSEERPLFGKYPGTFWIPAHARGNSEVGTVLKDYDVVQSGAAS
jgi:hypothetical protein